ncbi:hypothetical protein L226DRAFT_143634 [Lentinus tigrinus ALCF2SS1-7]|uniref:uncharacterized protein n=1 Tax=Lentinus tigrinus ALCF2SS1-7 TaxID=1328758 RepID=UPI0011661D64|nr:hypothetical protein L226DRAFT_143634 [Lentinus tigrinus ALCF2SS1-7]
MSSAADFQSFVTSIYCACAATTLIFVEYLALLPQEIDLFWKRRLTGASVLFLCNRYLSLLAQVFIYLNLTSGKLRHHFERILGHQVAAVLLLCSVFRLTDMRAGPTSPQMATGDARAPIVFRACSAQLHPLPLVASRCTTNVRMFL